tara:strand:+ start:396 stop:1853 length:1458 start_codon:yes stop_codon:yes gene_type:complete
MADNLKNTFIKIINTIKRLFYIIIDFIVNNKNYYRYSIGLLLIILFIILYYAINYITNLDIIKNNTYLSKFTDRKYSQVLVLLLFSIFLSTFYFFIHRNEFKPPSIYENNRTLILDTNKFNKENFKNTIKSPIFRLIKSLFVTIFLVAIPVILIVGFFWLFNYQQMYNITQLLLGFTLVITTLSIIAYLFNVSSKSNNDCKSDNIVGNYGCLIKNIIFFIPCLLIALVDIINKDIKLTPKPIYLLLLIELIIIVLLFFVPYLFKFIASINKNDLLEGEGPFYLNSKKYIGSYQQLSKEDNKFISSDYKSYSLFDEETNPNYNVKAEIDGPEKIIKSPYKYTYSISFYLYINPQPSNTSLAYNKETELFNYGFKPVIYYNGKSRSLVIKSKTVNSNGDQLDTIYKTSDFKYQKWLYFVINYDNNKIDVFLDGELVGSKENVPPFFNNDKVTLGEDNGIHGSIKDIYYFDKVRPADDIEFIHNMFKN